MALWREIAKRVRGADERHLSTMTATMVMAMFRVVMIAASPVMSAQIPAPSVVEVPISIDLAALQTRIEPAIPKTIGSLQKHVPDSSGRWASRYRIDRGPLSLAMVKGRLESTADIQYGIEVCGMTKKRLIVGDTVLFPCASCGIGEPRRSAVLSLQSDIAVGADWKLRVTTRPAPARFLKRCAVTMFGFDVTDRFVAPQLRKQLARIAGEIDHAAAGSIALHTEASKAWMELQKPIPAGAGRWLLLSPSAPTLSPLGGEGRMARVSLSVTLQPRVVRSPAAPRVAAQALPALVRRQASGRGFRTPFDFDVALSEVQPLIDAQVAGKRWRVGDRDVDVSRAALSTIGDRVAVTLDVKFVHVVLRTFQGKIVITGLPAYDVATRTVSLRDLDYSLEPENRKLLFRTVDRLAHDSLRDTIQKAARWPIAAEEDRLRKDLDEALDRDLGNGTRMRGSIDAIRPVAITAGNGELHVVALAEGEIRVAVGQKR